MVTNGSRSSFALHVGGQWFRDMVNVTWNAWWIYYRFRFGDRENNCDPQRDAAAAILLDATAGSASDAFAKPREAGVPAFP